MIFSIRTIGSGTKFRFLALEPPVLALEIYHSSWRNSLPFTSLRSVTVGSGRGFFEGDTCRGLSRGLLERWLDPVPEGTGVVVHEDVASVEEQVVRAVAVKST